MSEIINNIGGFLPLSYGGAPHRTPKSVSDSPSAREVEGSVGDTFELSSFGRALSEATESSTFRIARVRAVRDEVERGDYETPERINGTVDRLLDVIG